MVKDSVNPMKTTVKQRGRTNAIEGLTSLQLDRADFAAWLGISQDPSVVLSVVEETNRRIVSVMLLDDDDVDGVRRELGFTVFKEHLGRSLELEHVGKCGESEGVRSGPLALILDTESHSHTHKATCYRLCGIRLEENKLSSG